MAETQTHRRLEGVVVEKADVPNLNGRIYPRAVLERIAASVKQRHGEMRYPAAVPKIPFEEEEMGRQMTIPVELVSHYFTNLRVDEEGQLVCDITVLTTSWGQVLSRALDDPDHKDKLGFGLRGFSRQDDEGLVTEYQFVTIDAYQKKE
jgi:hypothetical protein